MQKQRLETLPPRELHEILEKAFKTTPLDTRDCIKAINKLAYNIHKQNFTPEQHRSIAALVLKSLETKDNYLKIALYALLEKLGAKNGEALIVGMNNFIKDLHSKDAPATVKNSALRALFVNVPEKMKYDFEKYISAALLNEKSRDIAVCIASQYFKGMEIGGRTFDRIDDYHLSYFKQLPINKYTSMLEIRRIGKGSGDVQKLSQYLKPSADSTTFFEAAKVLLGVRQEIAAPYIDKMVDVLKSYLSKGVIEQFASMKILSRLSISFPTKVARANAQISELTHTNSKTISMLAILILLKTGTDETARHLAAKLAPLMGAMPESYKTMAIDTIERLSRGTKGDFLGLLKSILLDKGHGSIDFKRFVVKKIETLVDMEDSRKEIVKLLCTYIEDPEYYQISMDALGILGQEISSRKDLVHIFNRIIIDNGHVRGCAYQALFDLDDRFDTFRCVSLVNDPETARIRSFLTGCHGIKHGAFDYSELGDLKPEVLKYLNVPAEEESTAEDGSGTQIKECRSIALTSPDSDFSIDVIKNIYRDHVVLKFSFENCMSNVRVGSCLLTMDTGTAKEHIKLSSTDFDGTKRAVKEIESSLCAGDVVNCVFEYQISLEEDEEEVEKDSIVLLPFDVNILDFIRPVAVETRPGECRTIDMKFKLKKSQAISKIVSACNMHMNVDEDTFELHGYYNDLPVIIEGFVTYSRYSSVEMKIWCDDEAVADEIAAVFD